MGKAIDADRQIDLRRRRQGYQVESILAGPRQVMLTWTPKT